MAPVAKTGTKGTDVPSNTRDDGAQDDAALSELAATLRLVVGRLDRRLRQHAIGGLTASQLSALAAIDRHGPLSLGKLAKIEGVSPPTLTGIVGRLSDRDLVARRQDETDARSTVVSVTDQGHATLAAVRGERTAFLVGRLEQLSTRQRAVLRDAAGILAGLLEDGR